jgi:acyl carrier protein
VDTVEILRDMIVEEFHLERDKVLPDTDLETLGIDSLSIIEFVFKVEDRFRIILPDPRTQQKPETLTAKRVWTLRNIAADLDALLAAQASAPPAPGASP